MTLTNLTPHEVVVLDNGGTVVVRLPPSGTVARCAATAAVAETVDGVTFYTTTYGGVTGLPAPAPGVRYVVSMLVRQAAPARRDLCSPGELVRGPDGQPVGCRGLVLNM